MAHFPANVSCCSFTAIGPLINKKPSKSLLVVTCHLRIAFTIKQIKARPVYKEVNNLLCNKGDWAAWAASSCCSTNSMNIILKKREMNNVNKLRVSCEHNLGAMLVLVGEKTLLMRTAQETSHSSLYRCVYWFDGDWIQSLTRRKVLSTR